MHFFSWLLLWTESKIVITSINFTGFSRLVILQSFELGRSYRASSLEVLRISQNIIVGFGFLLIHLHVPIS